MSRGKYTTRRSRRDPTTQQLNNRIDDLIYETIAHIMVDSGYDFMNPTGQAVAQFSANLEATWRNQSRIRSQVQPMLRAVSKEAQALGMHESEVRDAVQTQTIKNIAALNIRRLNDAIKRISGEFVAVKVFNEVTGANCQSLEEMVVYLNEHPEARQKLQDAAAEPHA